MSEHLDRKSDEKPAISRKKTAVLGEEQRIQVRDLIEDVYSANKWKIMQMSFLRGLTFGFGTFIGGTIVVAFLVWFLSQTVDLFPPIRDFIERLIQSLQN